MLFSLSDAYEVIGDGGSPFRREMAAAALSLLVKSIAIINAPDALVLAICCDEGRIAVLNRRLNHLPQLA